MIELFALIVTILILIFILIFFIMKLNIRKLRCPHCGSNSTFVISTDNLVKNLQCCDCRGIFKYTFKL